MGHTLGFDIIFLDVGHFEVAQRDDLIWVPPLWEIVILQ